ncbi:MAG: RidA family protein [Acidobacteria bacterium]|nr:RidA family protein [Acidobacteriota bacterium]
MTIEEKLRAMGLELPEPPKPVASYVQCVRADNLVFVSGQVPRVKGELPYRGKVGVELSIEQGQQAARACALNGLSVLKQEIKDLARLRRVVKLTVFVASANGFQEQPKVADGASQLLAELLGEKGQHARATVGVNELPLGVAVEMDMIVEVEG